MLVINEQEVLAYWLWKLLTDSSLEEIEPESLSRRVQRFANLTTRTKFELMNEMIHSEWYA